MAPTQSKPVVEETFPPSDLQEAAPFPLMRLPSEIRLLVLEQLLGDLKYALDWEAKCCRGAWCCGVEPYLDVSESVPLPISIFHICSRLRDEALSVLQRKTCLFLEYCGRSVWIDSWSFARYLHPLLFDNISKIGISCNLGLNDLLDDFPRLETVLVLDHVSFNKIPSDPNSTTLGHQTTDDAQPGKDYSSENYEQHKQLTLAQGLACEFHRGPDLQNPAKGFRFKLLASPDDLKRPLKILLGVDFSIGRGHAGIPLFHGRFDVLSGAFVIGPGWSDEFASLDKWAEDLHI